MTDPMNTIAGSDTGRASMIMRRFPPFAQGWPVSVFVAFVGALLFVSFVLPIATRRVIDFRQRTLPENYVRRAIEALEANHPIDPLGKPGAEMNDEARLYVTLALDTTIHPTGQGNATYSLTVLYTHLARSLEARGWSAEARAMAWKAIRHHQRTGRPLLNPEPWRVLQRSYLKDDPARFLQVFEILCARSVRDNKDFLDSIFKEHPAYVDYAALRNAYYNFFHRRFSRMVKSSPPIRDNTEMDVAARVMTARIYSSGGRRQKMKAVVEGLTRDYPDRLETQAQAAKSHSRVEIRWFVERLKSRKSKSGWQVSNFRELGPVPSEHRDPPEVKIYESGSAGMLVSGAAQIEFDAPVAADGLYIEASGTEFLDMFPIATIQIDGGEVYPMHFDSRERDLFHVALPFDAGKHTLRIEFLNDYGGHIRGENFNRNLVLRHLIIPARAD